MDYYRKIGTLILGTILLAGCAGNPYPTSSAVAKSSRATDTKDARQILREMATTLATAPGFSVTVRSDYDAIQIDGQSIAFGEKREIQLQRPDKLRVDSLRSDGQTGMILLDGQTITAFKPQQNAYIQMPRTGTVNETVVYMVKDLQLSLPLARLLLTSLPQELDKLLSTAAYVERDNTLDVPTDHIAARSADVDVQVWVTLDKQRVPRRIVITYKNEPGMPQYRADLTNWNVKPCFKKDLFSWTPPANAERIMPLPSYDQSTAAAIKPAAVKGAKP